jgi:hypothetical protein
MTTTTARRQQWPKPLPVPETDFVTASPVLAENQATRLDLGEHHVRRSASAAARLAAENRHLHQIRTDNQVSTSTQAGLPLHRGRGRPRHSQKANRPELAVTSVLHR